MTTYTVKTVAKPCFIWTGTDFDEAYRVADIVLEKFGTVDVTEEDERVCAHCGQTLDENNTDIGGSRTCGIFAADEDMQHFEHDPA